MRSPAPTISEADLQSAILDLAQMRGWRCVHFRPARTGAGWRTPIQGDPGWPDLTLCRPPRLVALELKSARGRVEPAQEAWLEALNRCGVEALVVRPSDWLSGAVEALLA